MMTIAVMSGKGGVGKSLISVLLSLELSKRGKNVLLLDFDICGPSIKYLLRGGDEKVHKTERGLQPIDATERISYLSMSSLIPEESSVVWRGPKKFGLLKLFYDSISPEKYDFVIIDTPPGLSNEHYFLIGKEAASLIVTTSQNVSLQKAEETIQFCKNNHIKILGVVENMSGYTCSICGSLNNLFSRNGGLLMAREMSVKFLGCVRISPDLGRQVESLLLLENYDNCPVGEDMMKIVDILLEE